MGLTCEQQDIVLCNRTHASMQPKDDIRKEITTYTEYNYDILILYAQFCRCAMGTGYAFYF